jgi:hypothetical protein
VSRDCDVIMKLAERTKRECTKSARSAKPPPQSLLFPLTKRLVLYRRAKDTGMFSYESESVSRAIEHDQRKLLDCAVFLVAVLKGRLSQ